MAASIPNTIDKSNRYTLDDLLYLMARLRDPNGGCPWDVEQNFQSIMPSTLEETYELVDAIVSEDEQQIKEELGDVLFQVIFYSQLGKEKDWFEFADVVDSIAEKLVRRHPHVFPNGNLRERFDQTIDVNQVKEQWEAIKQKERNAKKQVGLLDDIPLALPALNRAMKIQKRVSGVGFDWPDAQSAFFKIREELDELEQAILENNVDEMQQELGDLLFSCVNVARHLKLDPEVALAHTNRKFESRFRYVEAELTVQNKTPESATLLEMDILWEQAKVKLRNK